MCAILAAFAGRAQDADAPINTTWHAYAEATSRTFYSIVTFCDSMFALAGFTDSTEMKTDSANAEGVEEGSGFVQYRRWKSFWEYRCEVTTGKLHDFAAAAPTGAGLARSPVREPTCATRKEAVCNRQYAKSIYPVRRRFVTYRG